MRMRGFTILEVLVASLIFTFIIASIYAVMNSGKDVYDADMGRLDLQSSARRALDTITAELRQSSLSNVTVSDDGAAIEFEIPVNISAGSAEYSGPIGYYINDNSELVREYPSGTEQVLALHASAIEFCCWNGAECVMNCSQADSVIVRIGFSTTVNRRTMEFNVTEKVVVRNDF